MKTITIVMKNGANHSYNDKDYPSLYSVTQDSITRIKYTSCVNNIERTLLIVPISEIKYIKFKYTEKW